MPRKQTTAMQQESSMKAEAKKKAEADKHKLPLKILQ
jgi:hypothetical protein